MKLFVRAGHSPDFPGALAYNGKYEHYYTKGLQSRVLNISNILSGYRMEVFPVRSTFSLSEKINWVNQKCREKDRLIDIHFNYNHPTATGTEVFVHPDTTEENKRTATVLVQQVSELLGIPVRRSVPGRAYKYDTESQHDTLGIIRRTRVPAILLEVCFMNEGDLHKYKGKEPQIAAAILDAYNERH